MKKILLTSAALGVMALAAPSAFAGWQGGGGGHPHIPNPPPPPVPGNPCVDLCDPDYADILQQLNGFQWAKNLIVDVDDAQDIVQDAVNAGNLINLADLAIELGTIDQNADVSQFAFNLVAVESYPYYGSNSVLSSIEQAATNVVNSVTAGTAVNIHQNVANAQGAFNTILGGSGGYDAELVDGELEVATQTAVNASNLVSIDTLNNEITQISTGSQVAINTAAFSNSGFGFHVETPDVYDLEQSATNVTNSVTLSTIDLDGFCACDYEVDQFADVGQIAVNSLSTMGDVQNIVQSATNVANSISMPSDDEE
jgi:hypothetical protein